MLTGTFLPFRLIRIKNHDGSHRGEDRDQEGSFLEICVRWKQGLSRGSGTGGFVPVSALTGLGFWPRAK